MVDLGADHRLRDPADWARYYAGPHAGTWTYGLPELPGQRAEIAASTRVAATGCYAVATILALAPLIAAGLAQPGRRGGGRRVRHHRRRPRAQAHLLASEVMGDLSPTRSARTSTPPEIKQATAAPGRCRSPRCWRRCRGASWPRSPRCRPGRVSTRDIRAALRAALRGRAVRPGAAGGDVAAHQGHARLERLPPAGRPWTATPVVLVVSAIDNLGKGAAGQAVQCANLMLGLPETAGLTADRRESQP